MSSRRHGNGVPPIKAHFIKLDYIQYRKQT